LLQAPRPGDIDPQVAKGWAENQGELRKALATCLILPVQAGKFTILADLGVLTVPEDYFHKTRLRKLRDRFSKDSGVHWGEEVTDENFELMEKMVGLKS
jgi:hypothetical protein